MMATPMRTVPALVAALALAAVGLLFAPRETPAATELPPESLRPAVGQGDVETGRELYLASCGSCHGREGLGTDRGPSLVGVGAASADFYLSTGRMPPGEDPDVQPIRKPPAFDQREIADLVAYVGSLDGGPPIPRVETDEALLQRGAELYIGNCSPCHGTTARGGAVGGGAIAPRLDLATPLQVGESMIVGPGQMPVFGLSEEDRNAVITYVAYLQEAPNPGGLSIGGIGPVPEGFVAWVVGLGILLPAVYLIGREWTAKRE